METKPKTVQAVFEDKSGKRLKAGDFIAYGHALGRCAGLRYGKVVQVKWSKYEEYDEQIPKIQVHGVNDDWNHNKAKLCEKKSTLAFPSRVLRIDRDQMPESYAKLLDTVETLADEVIPIEAKQNRLDKI